MRDDMRERITRELPDAVINGDQDRGLYGTLALSLPGLDSRALVPVLDSKNVYVNVGCACSKGASSRTLRALGLSDDMISGSLRISLSYLNTPQECERLCSELVAAVRDARRKQQQQQQQQQQQRQTAPV